MPQETMLGGVLEFLARIGIFDVVLPFLLTFTIIFAILEKTRVLGTEKIGGETYPRKNLNAMVSFVISFFVIASSKLVEILTQVSAQVVVLVIMLVFFLMLVGTMYGEKEEIMLADRWRSFFMFFTLVALLLIFLQAIKLDSGESWLSYGMRWLSRYWSAPAVGSLILVILIIIFIRWITAEQKKKE